VGEQFGEEGLRLRLRQPFDHRAPLAAEEEAEAPGFRMGADEGMDHVREARGLGQALRLRRVGEEVAVEPRAAVADAQPLDPAARRLRQCSQGGDAVGVARVPLHRRDDDGVEEGEQPGMPQVVVVGVPVQPDLRRAGSLAVPLGVADEEDSVVLGQAEVAAAVQVEIPAEAGCPGEVAGGRQMGLAAHQQQGALHHGAAEDGGDLRVLRRREVEAADLDADDGFQLADGQAASAGGGGAPGGHGVGHGRSPLRRPARASGGAYRPPPSGSGRRAARRHAGRAPCPGW